MDLDQAADELYLLTPAEFTARRTELVAAARAGADRAAAKAIAGLRRPTVCAWLVNRLARTGSPEFSELIALGEQTRQAQAELDGGRLRELSRQRQPAVAAVVARASQEAEAAGQRLTATVQRELEETLAAAIADPQAAQAVTSGLLTRSLAYAGLGAVDLNAATALSLNAIHPVRGDGSARQVAQPAGPRVAAARAASTRTGAGAGAGAGASAGATEAAQRAAARARAVEEHRRAAAAAQTAADQLEQARQHERDLIDQVDRLQEQLARARRELVTATHQVGVAEREAGRHRRAERQAWSQVEGNDG